MQTELIFVLNFVSSLLSQLVVVKVGFLHAQISLSICLSLNSVLLSCFNSVLFIIYEFLTRRYGFTKSANNRERI